jgi:hypothetical protein
MSRLIESAMEKLGDNSQPSRSELAATHQTKLRAKWMTTDDMHRRHGYTGSAKQMLGRSR